MTVELKKVGLCGMEFRWSQPYPGLAGDSPPLLFSCEAPSAVLCSVLDDPAQEGGGPAQANPEAATKVIGGLEHLSYEDKLNNPLS